MEGAFCAGQVALFSEHIPKAVCTAGVVALIGAPVGGLGAIEITSVVEQYPEVERGECVATLVGPTVRSLGGRQIVPVLEQHAQIERAGRMPELVSSLVESLSGFEVAALGQDAAEIKRHISVGELSLVRCRRSGGGLDEFRGDRLSLGRRGELGDGLAVVVARSPRRPYGALREGRHCADERR